MPNLLKFMLDIIQNVIHDFESLITGFFFFPIPFGDIIKIPFLVLWMVSAALFFTFSLKFVNLRFFGHALSLAFSRKHNDPDAPGSLTHFQAVSTALSGTVGLGNIAGVAIAVSMGGPGVIFWIMVTGFFCMSLKFSEILLAHKYRTIYDDNTTSGGSFIYLQSALDGKMKPVGKFLAYWFGIFCMFGAIGSIAFQVNNTATLFENSYEILNGQGVYLCLIIAFFVGIVLIGGVRRIAHTAEKIVPFMTILYVICAMTIIIANYDQIIPAIKIIFSSAFNFEAFSGGMIGVFIIAIQRAFFSNESGLGSAPIVHSNTKTREPVSAACGGLLEPFFDTIVICFISGLLITVTGTYNMDTEGVIIASKAFESFHEFLPYVLSIIIILFAYSTIITWSYYGGEAYCKIFNTRKTKPYYFLLCIVIILSGIISTDVAIALSDSLVLPMTIPNILGLYLLRKEIWEETRKYKEKYFSKS